MVSFYNLQQCLNFCLFLFLHIFPPNFQSPTLRPTAHIQYTYQRVLEQPWRTYEPRWQLRVLTSCYSCLWWTMLTTLPAVELAMLACFMTSTKRFVKESCVVQLSNCTLEANEAKTETWAAWLQQDFHSDTSRILLMPLSRNGTDAAEANTHRSGDTGEGMKPPYCEALFLMASIWRLLIWQLFSHQFMTCKQRSGPTK